MLISQIHASAEDLFRRLQAADQAPRCHHVKSNGVRCGSPALTGKTFCFFHHRLRRPRPASPSLPPLEDANAIQCALMRVTEALLHRELDPKTAGLLLYALQIASFNLKRVNFEPLGHKLVLLDPEDPAPQLWDAPRENPDPGPEVRDDTQ